MVAVSVLVMAYSGLMGPLGIVLFYGLWLPWMVIKGSHIAWPPKGSRFPLIYLALCSASIFWSDYPPVTIRAAIELGTLILCTFIMAKTVSNAAYARGLIAGIDLVLLASLASGNYGTDAFGGPPTLVGLFGSKNQLGFFAELGTFLALIFLPAKTGRLEKLAYCGPALVLGALCMAGSHSASSTASLVVTLAVVTAVYAVSGFSKRLRIGITVGAAVLLPVLLIVGVSFGLQDMVLQAFGKDATLTGRTYLWGWGYKIGMRNPGFGVGYAAFWVPGRPEAERFWYEFFIGSKSGFHFHDTYVEIFVELGLAGFSFLVLWLLRCLYSSIRAATVHGTRLEFILPVGLSVMLLIRSFVEVDVLGPFGIGLFLLLPQLTRIAMARREAIEAGSGRRPPAQPVKPGEQLAPDRLAPLR